MRESMTRMSAPGVLVAPVLVLVLAASCSKGESGPETGPNILENTPPAEATESADAAPPPSHDSGVPEASTVAVAPAPRPAREAQACGDKPLAPCPLNAWMKANTSRAMNAQDFGGLSAALEQVVTFAPPDYVNWASIARDGASAARDENLEAVRAACRGCHSQYKDKYKKEMRDRPL